MAYYIDLYEDLNFSYCLFWYTPLSLFIGVSFSTFQADISILGVWFSGSAYSWLSMYFWKWGSRLISIVFIDLGNGHRLIFPGRLSFWTWQLPGCRAMGVTKILAGWVGRACWQTGFLYVYEFLQVHTSKERKPPRNFLLMRRKERDYQEADSSKRFTTRLRYPSLPLISPWCYVKNKEFFKKINNGLMVQLLKLIRNSTFLLWLLIYNIHYVQIWWGNSECHEAGPCSLGVYPFWGALALM